LALLPRAVAPLAFHLLRFCLVAYIKVHLFLLYLQFILPSLPLPFLHHLSEVNKRTHDSKIDAGCPFVLSSKFVVEFNITGNELWAGEFNSSVTGAMQHWLFTKTACDCLTGVNTENLSHNMYVYRIQSLCDATYGVCVLVQWFPTFQRIVAPSFSWSIG
jgi:hypothetical protein